MAVNIDTVYQRVLAIANKEQRGYITPQEFNLLANQAQMEVFEEYFYDINKFDRINKIPIKIVINEANKIFDVKEVVPSIYLATELSRTKL